MMRLVRLKIPNLPPPLPQQYKHGTTGVRCASKPCPEKERNDRPVSHKPSHNYQLSHVRSPLSSHPFLIAPLSSSRPDHRPTPRPPAQDDCERIEDVPAFTATHSTTLSESPTAFPTFGSRRSALAKAACKGAAPRYPSY
jgi:hypothetical protein